MNRDSIPVIETVDLKKYYKVRGGSVHAVDGINVRIGEGETLGVVGESGCGKSTLGRAIIGLEKPTSGQVFYRGQDTQKMDSAERKRLHTRMSMIFQDPFSSLNPRMSVAELIEEPMRVNRLYGSREGRFRKVRELMDTTGIAERLAGSYPHELDGGRRQRIGIARALAVEPEFIVCDEPVSALDVSIQAQILNLLMDLRDEMGLTYMFITHDLSVVRHISTNVLVTYLGKCIEYGSTEDIFRDPRHPYTKALFSAIPIPDLKARGQRPVLLKGEVSNAIDPKPGCRFAPRCPYRTEACVGNDIALRDCGNGHLTACVLDV